MVFRELLRSGRRHSDRRDERGLRNKSAPREGGGREERALPDDGYSGHDEGAAEGLRLPSERRRIFLLSKRDGLKYQEIAEELHISVKTVEVQISKALKALRETAIRIYTFFFG